MLGVHAFWSKPTLSGTNGHHLYGVDDFHMHNFEIVHFLLSALFYRKLNGPIKLYTDITFFNYLKDKNLLHFWDEVDTSLSVEFEELNLDSRSNWTSFKTWLLGKIPAPFILLDHDNLIYSEIPKQLFETPVRFAHLELPDPYYYPSKDQLKVKNFKFDEEWDWTLNVSNTCMLYFRDDEFKNLYSQKSIEFQLDNSPEDSHLSEVQYLFADQRLLLMLLHQHNIEYGTFSNSIFGSVRPDDDPVWVKYSDDPVIKQVKFDHTWAYKHTLVEKLDERRTYMERHKGMILINFPEYINNFKQFFDDPQL